MSTAVAVPTGPIDHWCIGGQGQSYCTDQVPFDGSQTPDYITICCDGTIADTSQDVWQQSLHGDRNITLNLDDLLCCQGDPFGTAGQLDCSNGAPTPLASLAATNTLNAQTWFATSIRDWHTPYCAWLGTTAGSVETVTVPTFAVTGAPQQTLKPGDPGYTQELTASPAAPTTLSGSTAAAAGTATTARSNAKGTAASSTAAAQSTPNGGASLRVTTSQLLPVAVIALFLSRTVLSI